MRSSGIVVAFALVACGGHLSATPPPPPEDAGLDAIGSDAETLEAASTTSWCATNAPNATLCDDFDLRTTPKTEWLESGSGLAVVDHALHVSAAPATGSFLSWAPKSAPVASKLEAEIEIVDDGTSSAAGDPVVLAIDGEGGQSVALVVIPGTANARCIDTGFAPSTTFAEFPFARGTWHFVSLKLSPNQDGTYNPLCGVDGASHGRDTAATVSAPIGNMTSVVGFTATTTQAMTADYDNVVLDVQQTP